jgi:uncharacterized protein (DUF1499 family)
MAWLRNWHDTDAPGAYPGPLDLPLPRDEALRRVEKAIRSLPRWRVEALEYSLGEITATRRTRLFRFTDDVVIRVEPTAGGSRVHVRSKSRVGKSDFGQNRRNVLELFASLIDRG